MSRKNEVHACHGCRYLLFDNFAETPCEGCSRFYNDHYTKHTKEDLIKELREDIENLKEDIHHKEYQIKQLEGETKNVE